MKIDVSDVGPTLPNRSVAHVTSEFSLAARRAPLVGMLLEPGWNAVFKSVLGKRFSRVLTIGTRSNAIEGTVCRSTTGHFPRNLAAGNPPISNMIRTLPHHLRTPPHAFLRSCRSLVTLPAKVPTLSQKVEPARPYATEAALPPSGNDMFANGGNAYYAEE